MNIDRKVRRIIDILKIRESEIGMLLHNGKDGVLDEEFFDGDVVSIFPPAGGG